MDAFAAQPGYDPVTGLGTPKAAADAAMLCAGPLSISAPASLQTIAGTPVTFQTSAVAAHGQPVTLSATGVPTGVTFDPATGLFSGTPDVPGPWNMIVAGEHQHAGPADPDPMDRHQARDHDPSAGPAGDSPRQAGPRSDQGLGQRPAADRLQAQRPAEGAEDQPDRPDHRQARRIGPLLGHRHRLRQPRRPRHQHPGDRGSSRAPPGCASRRSAASRATAQG